MPNVIRFMGVNKDTRTAGPGRRLEFFTKGCIRGVIAPCEGCFNQSTWTFEGKFRPMSVDEVVEICLNNAWNRQVTFCGGEPILQAKALGQVAKKLKEIDSTFHFVMYTAYDLEVLQKSGLRFMWKKDKHEDAMLDHLKDYSSSYEVKETDEEGNPTKVKFVILTPDDVEEVMQHIDLIVDGDFQWEKRIPTAKYMNEGQFIGSNNQRVIHAPASLSEGELIYQSPEEFNELMNAIYSCKTCGHAIEGDIIHEDFCNDLCKSRYEQRQKDMALIGGV